MKELVLEHLKPVPGIEHVFGQERPQRIRHDTRNEKPASLDPTLQTPPKPIESLTKINSEHAPREIETVDIDSLEHDIYSNFEENSPD